VTLLHGPGCPVCVTAVELIDKAIEIASRPDVIFCSFGDMMRVPGTKRDLLSVKASGGDVRMVYSPLDALKLAREFPDKQVVFFAVGFETTAPANAMAVFQADQQKIENFSVLVSHVLVPPAIEAILSSPTNRVQGFLAAGHVCTVMGYTEYEPLARKYHVPMVVTGQRFVFGVAHHRAHVPCCQETLYPVGGRTEDRFNRRGNQHVRDQYRKVLDLLLVGLEDGHRVRRGSSLEADGEKHDLLIREFTRQLERIQW